MTLLSFYEFAHWSNKRKGFKIRSVNTFNLVLLLMMFLFVSLDMDQDGTFRWVDKTNIEFSNWNPNFPKNTDKLWDCGQIYTGERERERDSHLQRKTVGL